MTSFNQKTILITGAASGIGLLMAELAISRGVSHLIMLDINKKALEQTREQLTSPGCEIHSIPVDLSSEIEIREALKQISARELQVDILINNAGIVTGKDFEKHSEEEIEKSIQVNSIAPMKLTLGLLPQMIRKGSGYIVNISSAAGMLANPGMSVYCASKWALSGWSHSLRIEMERKSTGVKVLTVTPYYIDTGMFRGVSSPLIPILKPEKVAKRIIRAIERERIILRTPGIIYLLPFVKGILPQRMLDVLIGKMFGIYDSMKTFKGRNDDQNPAG
ncbi:SDR family oxidoreductase [Gramella sp. KN1008]|uniref:SDR family oxidoreductase n=1 Tax=Gramella sp. KN1008 TaxID=2529298 RepID=UPI00103CA271|nr:SDR family oxidoreductase [Gramella sp. KN1008]TBW28901.1 SDR family NAD(P)-dependent oxidoreductase [Gramella sp. KN1008]